MNVSDALVQRFTQRMTRMRAALEMFDDASAEWALVSDRWNVRDLVGHFVFWVSEAAQWLPKLAAGTPARQYDLEKTNEDVYRKYKRMSFVMLLPQLREAEERFLTVVRSIKLEILIDETEAREWIDTSIAHYDHHWPGLRAAAGRRGS